MMTVPPPALLAGLIGFRRQPVLDIGRLLRGIEQTHGEQPLGRRLIAMRGQQPGCGIELAQAAQ